MEVYQPARHRIQTRVITTGCRTHTSGGLERLCHGLYLFTRAGYRADLLLYHAAARLRAGTFS